MKRPAWAAAPGFTAAWSYMEAAQARPLVTDDGNRLDAPDFSSGVLRVMQAARVIVVPRPQVDALPAQVEVVDDCGDALVHGDDFDAMLAAVRLPFEIAFFDLGGAARATSVPDSQGRSVTAALLFQTGGRMHGLSWTGARMGDPRSERMGMTPLVASWASGESVTFKDPIGVAQHFGEDDMQGMISDALGALERVAAVCTWMQSYNVELAEVEMRPKQRRRELAKGREIPLTVRVKRSKRRARSTAAAGRMAHDYQWETAGHYIHHWETKADGTPNLFFERVHRANPDKVCAINGKPCVRIWQPPHVRGPADKPLVPKVRVVA